MTDKTLQLGLIGLGRLGAAYARILAGLRTPFELVGLADTHPGRAEQMATQLKIPRSYLSPTQLLDDEGVDAVVIVTPTHTHRALVEEAAVRGKAVFCEKPVSISLKDAWAVKRAVDEHGIYFQLGFMRRFDAAHVAAKQKIEEGVIGTPVLCKSSSRDPYPPPLDFLDPEKSGGTVIDMGMHDFDAARWFMGDVKQVSTVGGALVHPEFEEAGDVDNAIVSLTFEAGGLGVVDLSRTGIYGYDVTTEILGTEGTLRIGYLRETPLLVLTENHVAHDTVPYFPQRFKGAYESQLVRFAENVLAGGESPVTVEDGIEALRIGVAATQALHTGQSVEVVSVR